MSAPKQPRQSTSETIPFANKCFTVNEAADHLRVSRAFIYLMLRDHRLHSIKLGTRTLIRGASIEQLLGAKP